MRVITDAGPVFCIKMLGLNEYCPKHASAIFGAKLKLPPGVKARCLIVVCAPLVIPFLSICVLAMFFTNAESFFSLGIGREYITWAILALNLANIGAAYWLARKFGAYLNERITGLLDNVVRFQNEEKLAYQKESSDEFDMLDNAFLDMAAVQRDTLARERDLIDNAGSIICAIDGDFLLQKVNPAVEKFLGYTPEQIVGTSILSLCSGEEQDELIETLYQVRYAAAEATIEVPMATSFRTVLLCSWMIKWSLEKNMWICVIQDITERKRAEAMRRQMVNMVSHDIRSPLSALQLIFTLLQTGQFATFTPKGLDILSGGERNCKILQNLTDNLLAIDRLEAGQVILELEPVKLDEQFKSIAIAFKAITEKRKITLDCQNTGLTIVADQPKLEQVLTNLVANAIKFTAEGGRVSMEAMQTREGISLAVRDNGQGIPRDALPYIFDRYHQVKGAKSAEKKGSGLGLAIVKALVELHGGQVNCDSQEGVGSIFVLNFPSSALTGAQAIIQ
jgi:PAS domain S-box-containing protein